MGKNTSDGSYEPPKGAPPADGVSEDNVNQESRIVPLEDDEKAGPRSIQSKEIRPDERPEAIGKSAFATQDPVPAEGEAA